MQALLFVHLKRHIRMNFKRSALLSDDFDNFCSIENYSSKCFAQHKIVKKEFKWHFSEEKMLWKRQTRESTNTYVQTSEQSKFWKRMYLDLFALHVKWVHFSFIFFICGKLNIEKFDWIFNFLIFNLHGFLPLSRACTETAICMWEMNSSNWQMSLFRSFVKNTRHNTTTNDGRKTKRHGTAWKIAGWTR